MTQVLLLALLPFVLGLVVNATYELLKNLRTGRRLHSSSLLGDHWIYWHNSRWMRSGQETPFSRARLTIFRDRLYRLRFSSREERQGPAYEGYDYDGTVSVTPEQVHLRMEGLRHGETCYAIFDRGLDRTAEFLPGLFLLTANDESKGAMSIRCFISTRAATSEEVAVCLGKKEFIDSLRIPAPWKRPPDPAAPNDHHSRLSGC